MEEKCEPYFLQVRVHFCTPYPLPLSSKSGKKMQSLSGADSSQETYSHGSFYMNLCHAKVFSSPAPGTEHVLLYILWAKQLRWVPELLLIGNKKRENKRAHMDQFIWNCSMCLQHVATLRDITHWFMKGRFRNISWLKMGADLSQVLLECLF